MSLIDDQINDYLLQDALGLYGDPDDPQYVDDNLLMPGYNYRHEGDATDYENYGMEQWPF